jgi:hypothetical protein
MDRRKEKKRTNPLSAVSGSRVDVTDLKLVNHHGGLLWTKQLHKCKRRERGTRMMCKKKGGH